MKKFITLILVVFGYVGSFYIFISDAVNYYQEKKTIEMIQETPDYDLLEKEYTVALL